LLGADTIPDMFRTTMNVTGHMAAQPWSDEQPATGNQGMNEGPR
jgi:Na+/H+-dicarboxylate symporter